MHVSDDHRRDFIDAVLAGSPVICPVEIGQSRIATWGAKTGASGQTSIMAVMERAGLQKSALDYLQKNAVREDVEAAASRLATPPK